MHMIPSPPGEALNPHLGAALAAAAGRISPTTVDEVWLFAPRQAGARETGLAVLCTYAEGGDDRRERRTLYTVQYEAESRPGGKTERTDTVTEQGTVPVDRVGRIIDGVVRRLGEEHPAPDVRATGGDPAKWTELLAALGAGVLDAPNQE
ncbi:MAG TPA: hypothetical protein VFX98_15475 [Longimicrobiaceae bacterium]|nr:hypothetical protein [Longimicrobiaceae bacterium]